MNQTLYKKVREKKFKPKHVAEVGVGNPIDSNIYQFIQDGIKTTLVEPHPEYITLIKKHFKNHKKITLFEVANCDFNGEAELCLEKDSSFINNLNHTPAIANNSINADLSTKILVKAQQFSQIDKGDIDLISIDTEGSEWFTIKHMKSRPEVISVETHCGRYKNPYIQEISKWMEENNYFIWYKTAADSIYVKKGAIQVTFFEKISLNLISIKLVYIYKRKKLNDKIYKLLKVKQFRNSQKN